MRSALPALLLAACTAPDPSLLFEQAKVSVEDEDGASAAFVERVGTAKQTVYAALPGGDDTELAAALVDAWESGVDVEVITDWDLRESPAARILAEAEVPLSLADDGVTYFEFNLGADTTWGSDLTRMTDAYLVVDDQTILAASTIGVRGKGARILYDLRGEDLVDDLTSEHRQIFGGTDAVATTAFDGPAKSITDWRWRYGTGDSTDLEMWFGPQERLIKRVIDSVYQARTQIRILTDDLGNEGLAKALQDKAGAGFDIQVVVGPAFGDTSSQLARIFEEETPDVDKRLWSEGDLVPTVVLVDYPPQEPSGQRARAEALVITHPLISATRLYRGVPVANDQLCDAILWGLSTSGELTPEMKALEDLFVDHQDAAEDL